MSELNLVKELRERTGCGIVDCKEALSEAGGDIEKAIEVLKKKGVVKAAKKADRETGEGVVASYIHGNSKIGVLVSLRCETDFVARNEKFQELARDIAMHIAATDPLVVSPEDVDEEMVEQEKKMALEQLEGDNKPDDIKEKIIEGKLNKFREERALLTQPFVKNPDQTVGDLVTAAVQEMGENISVGEFSRVTV